MKTILITLTVAFALTHAATAGTSTWFRGGIGLPDWSFTSSAGKNIPKQTTAKTSQKSIYKKTDRRVASR